MKPRFSQIIPLIALVFLAAGNRITTTRVKAVHDGDTFTTVEGWQVRMLGIDAPELYQPGGDIARDILGGYLLNKTVKLEPDREDKDRYGRLLRYVYVGDTLINAEMVRKGYAAFQPFQESLKLADTLAKLEETAARIGKGLWAFNVFTPRSLQLLTQKLNQTGTDSTHLLVIPYTKADSFIGRLVAVEGVVVNTYRSKKILILNFHQDYKRHFSAVIFATDLSRFPPHPEDFYNKRRLRVTGIIKEYKGAPQIVVKDPAQIQILE